VPAGDVEAAAARVVQLLQSPEQVERTGSAAQTKAGKHGTTAFLKDWSHVLSSIVELKPYRTRTKKIDFDLKRLRARPARGLKRWLPRRHRRRKDITAGSTVEFAGVLRVDGASDRSDLDSAELYLSLVHHNTGAITNLRLDIERRNERFDLRSVFSGSELVGREGAGPVALRLQFVWQNQAWTRTVERYR
jgi:hypothetical protein